MDQGPLKALKLNDFAADDVRRVQLPQDVCEALAQGAEFSLDAQGTEQVATELEDTLSIMRSTIDSALRNLEKELKGKSGQFFESVSALLAKVRQNTTLNASIDNGQLGLKLESEGLALINFYLKAIDLCRRFEAVLDDTNNALGALRRQIVELEPKAASESAERNERIAYLKASIADSYGFKGVLDAKAIKALKTKEKSEDIELAELEELLGKEPTSVSRLQRKKRSVAVKEDLLSNLSSKLEFSEIELGDTTAVAKNLIEILDFLKKANVITRSDFECLQKSLLADDFQAVMSLAVTILMKEEPSSTAEQASIENSPKNFNRPSGKFVASAALAAVIMAAFLLNEGKDDPGFSSKRQVSPLEHADLPQTAQPAVPKLSINPVAVNERMKKGFKPKFRIFESEHPPKGIIKDPDVFMPQETKGKYVMFEIPVGFGEYYETTKGKFADPNHKVRWRVAEAQVFIDAHWLDLASGYKSYFGKGIGKPSIEHGLGFHLMRPGYKLKMRIERQSVHPELADDLLYEFDLGEVLEGLLADDSTN